MLNKKLADVLSKYPKNFILFLIETESINHCISRIHNKIKHDLINKEYNLYKHNILQKKACVALNKPEMQGFEEYMKLSKKADKLWNMITLYHDKVRRSLNERATS